MECQIKHNESPSSFSITGKRMLLFFNCILLGIGISGGPLVMRLYYLHGGKRIWFQACLETAGFPIMIIPLTLSYIRRRRADDSAPLFVITPPLIACSAAVGLVAGTADYMYARGVGLIPVSTSSLILSTQMAFTAVFCYLLVRQRFTAFSVNAVFLLTVAAAVLALHAGDDVKKGVSLSQYLMGFFMTLVSAALFALMLPMVELSYTKAHGHVTYDLVMEMQFVLSLTATAFCLTGMAINNDFQAITREIKQYGLGEATYVVVMILSALVWQMFYIGALGVIHFGSSLLSGIIIAACLPVTEILAVIFYKEEFQAEKAVALLLSVWGFVSYFYGEIKSINKKKKKRQQLCGEIRLE